MTNSATEFAPWYGVFETLRVIDGVPLFMEAHRKELARALAALGLECDFDFEKARSGLPRLSGRWRWLVTREETRAMFHEESWVPPERIALSVSPVRVGSKNWDARFKTLSYLSHAQAWQTKTTPEVILLNEHGHVASAARANIFWKIDGHLFTPAHEAGCRCGAIRSFVCNRLDVKTGCFPLSDLHRAEEIFLTGSMRGIVSVSALEEYTYPSFSTANALRYDYDKEVDQQLGR